MSVADGLSSTSCLQDEAIAGQCLAPHEAGSSVARVQQGESREEASEDASMERQVRLESENARLLAMVRQELHRWGERGEDLRRLSGLSALQNLALRTLNHECRSPLQSIFGITTLLLRRAPGNLTEEQAQLVQLIRKAADDLIELIEDFTEPERLDRTPVRLACLDAAELLRTLEGMLPAPLIKPDVALVFAAGKNLPPLVSDQRKVLQILRNLVNNALRCTARGEVRVGVTHDPGNGTVVFSVKDTGPGISHEQQKELVGDLSRDPVDGSAPKKGLGLPLCHGLAAVLGGRIALESAPGSGSTFSLLLPQHSSVADSQLDSIAKRLSEPAAGGALVDVFHEQR